MKLVSRTWNGRTSDQACVQWACMPRKEVAKHPVGSSHVNWHQEVTSSHMNWHQRVTTSFPLPFSIARMGQAWKHKGESVCTLRSDVSPTVPALFCY